MYFLCKIRIFPLPYLSSQNLLLPFQKHVPLSTPSVPVATGYFYLPDGADAKCKGGADSDPVEVNPKFQKDLFLGSFLDFLWCRFLCFLLAVVSEGFFGGKNCLTGQFLYPNWILSLARSEPSVGVESGKPVGPSGESVQFLLIFFFAAT